MAPSTLYDDSALMTVAEVASLMRVSNMTVYRVIHAGELRAVRIGRSFRIWEKDVQRYLEESKVLADDTTAAPTFIPEQET